MMRHPQMIRGEILSPPWSRQGKSSACLGVIHRFPCSTWFTRPRTHFTHPARTELTRCMRRSPGGIGAVRRGLPGHGPEPGKQSGCAVQATGAEDLVFLGPPHIPYPALAALHETGVSKSLRALHLPGSDRPAHVALRLSTVVYWGFLQLAGPFLGALLEGGGADRLVMELAL